LLRLERLKRSLLLQDVGSAFELQGYIEAHLGKKLPYRFDFAARGDVCSEAADQIPDLGGLRRDLFDRDC
jgi:hypothetical protein